ncbi:hypothetical protein NKH77_27770 [Streptomyces sp. M19]
MAYTGERMDCAAEAVVPRLREGGYEQRDSIRYATGGNCAPFPGTSGSALLAPTAPRSWDPQHPQRRR